MCIGLSANFHRSPYTPPSLGRSRYFLRKLNNYKEPLSFPQWENQCNDRRSVLPLLRWGENIFSILLFAERGIRIKISKQLYTRTTTFAQIENRKQIVITRGAAALSPPWSSILLKNVDFARTTLKSYSSAAAQVSFKWKRCRSQRWRIWSFSCHVHLFLINFRN